MVYAPLCNRKIIIGLAVYSVVLLAAKFFLEEIDFTEYEENIISMFKLIYVGYFIICLMYTGFIFSAKRTDYSSAKLKKNKEEEYALIERQQIIIKALKRPIVLLLASSIMLICIFGNWIVSFITIICILGILWKMEDNHRRILNTTR